MLRLRSLGNASLRRVHRAIGLVGSRPSHEEVSYLDSKAQYQYTCPAILRRPFSTEKPKEQERDGQVGPQSETEKESTGETKSLSTYQWIKHTWNQYGWISLRIYVTLYAISGASIFGAIGFDLVDLAAWGFDTQYMIDHICTELENWGSEKAPAYIREHPRAAKFAIALFVHELAEPVRIGITLALAPYASSMLYTDDDHKDADKRHQESVMKKDRF